MGSKAVLTSTGELEWSLVAAPYSKIVAVCRVIPVFYRIQKDVPVLCLTISKSMCFIIQKFHGAKGLDVSLMVNSSYLEIQ